MHTLLLVLMIGWIIWMVGGGYDRSLDRRSSHYRSSTGEIDYSKALQDKMNGASPTTIQQNLLRGKYDKR